MSDSDKDKIPDKELEFESAELTDAEIDKIAEAYKDLNEGGELLVSKLDPDVPNPVDPNFPIPEGAVTDFKYKFSKNKSKGKVRPRDTFYREFAALNIECGAILTVHGDPKEDDECDWKLGGGEHTDSKPKAGKCYAIGWYFDGKPFMAKELKHPNPTVNMSKYCKIAEGAPKSLGNMRGRRHWERVKKYIEGKTVKIEYYINLLDGKGEFLWWTAVDDGSWDKGGAPYLKLNGDANKSKELVYMRIDSIVKKTECESMWAYDLGGIVVEPPPDPHPCPPKMHWDRELQKCIDNEPEPVPGTGLNEHGTQLLFETTGKKVAMKKGSNHRNGQRYNVNHKYQNSMTLGYFKIGEGQEVIEEKNDGPNHGGCKQLPECCWTEIDFAINKGGKKGMAYVSAEYPHPENKDPPKSIPSAKNLNEDFEGKWIGWGRFAMWTTVNKEGGDGGTEKLRRIGLYIDPDPFNVDGTPKNGWIKVLDEIDSGQITNEKLARRELPVNFDEGLEAEIRMHGATKGDTEMKWCYVYELAVV